MSRQLSYSQVVVILISFVLLLQLQKHANLLAQISSEKSTITSLKADTTLANEYFTKAEKLAKEAKYDSSNVYFEKAIDIIQKITTQYDDQKIWEKFVQSYNGIGENYIEKGDYELALEKLQFALKTGLARFGENHPDVADSYNNIGSVHSRKANYVKALEYYQRSLNIWRKTLGEKHPDIAISYNNIGGIYHAKGDYDKALEYFQKSLNIRLEMLGDNHPDIAQSYNNIGHIYTAKGEYDKALESHQKCLNILRNTLGDDHPYAAFSYTNIGLVYYKKGEYDKALKYFQNSLNIDQKVHGDNHPYVARTNNNIGAVHFKNGEYNKALEYYQKSLNIRIKTLGENHPEVAESYYNIGHAYDEKGDYNKALEYTRKCLNIELKAFGDNHPTVAISYNSIGGIYSAKGDYDKALEYYQKSLNIRFETLGNNHPDVANSYNNIGYIYSAKGDYDKALEYYQKSLNIWHKILGENHPDVARSYNNIASVHSRKGNYEKALEYYQRSLNIWYKTLGENHPDVATSYNNTGGIYKDAKGDYEKALEYYQKSLNIRLNKFGENHPLVAQSYNNIGTVYERKGDYDNALFFFQKAMVANIVDFQNFNIYNNPILEDILSNKIFLTILTNKADAFFKRYKNISKDIKDIRTALKTYQLTVALIDTIRSSYQVEGSKLFLAEQSSEVYEKAIKTTLTLFEITSDTHYKEQAFVLAEKSKSAVLREALSDLNAKQFAGIPDSLLEKERDLRIDLAYYDTQIQKEKQKKDDRDSLKIADFESRYFALNWQYERLIAEFEKTYPKYYDLKYQTQTASMRELQEALDRKTALVEYSVGDSSLFIFVLSKQAFEVVSVAIDSTFEQAVSQFYTSIKKLNKNTFLENSALLYSKLIQPIAKYIAAKEKLVVIPAGRLHYIPFEALVPQEALLAGKSGLTAQVNFAELDYLIRRFAISYHYSATLFAENSKAQPQTRLAAAGDFVGFAPVFSDSVDNGRILASHRSVFDTTYAEALRSVTVDGVKLKEIKFTEEEVESIVELFGAKKRTSFGYFHKEASEENFKSQAGQYKYVHIATHGILNEAQPKLSAIVFSQPTDTSFTEDGVLYAGETYNLNLNADLVVLSSCESGIGKLVKGEGLMALTRGFLYAGAPNIIFSLWKVYDIYTKELMVEFYRNVVSGKSYSEALRQAKLAMIQNETTSFPSMWSAFVLVGR